MHIYVKLLYTCLVYNMHIFVCHYICRHNNNNDNDDNDDNSNNNNI